jgi:hypothetical protein
MKNVIFFLLLFFLLLAGPANSEVVKSDAITIPNGEIFVLEIVNDEQAVGISNNYCIHESTETGNVKRNTIICNGNISEEEIITEGECSYITRIFISNSAPPSASLDMTYRVVGKDGRGLKYCDLITNECSEDPDDIFGCLK